MARFTQEHRLLSATTALGADVLLLKGFHGREELSRLFHYTLDFWSEDEAIAPTAIVGKEIGWTVHASGEPRHFHGVVSRFAAGPRHVQGLRAYRAEVVPWLWFLTRSADCRIYQKQDVEAIVTSVFERFGFKAFSFNLRCKYPKREYCVQYRETAFQFVSRLLEEEGIFYFFRHEEGKHTLVLADDTSVYRDCRDHDAMYDPAGERFGRITDWEHQYEFRSGKWTVADYNFQTPTANLQASTNTLHSFANSGRFEVFEYPGHHAVKDEGESRVKLRMEEEETACEIVRGASGYASFTPGETFTLTLHDCDSEENKRYVVTAIEHNGNDESHTNTNSRASYGNRFTCIPDTVAFRPARTTPRPVVQGPQTAIVVGKSGEELQLDEYGRVKVQFFWDRQGQCDENSSCWIRVAENWAGKNWGAAFHPRIGQEVVVDFLEGYPDRPLITGRVYNADQMPPYDPKKHPTRSGIKTRTSKGGAENFNELRFEDKKDGEQVFLHAEKDMDWRVKKDSREFVGQDRHRVVKGNVCVSVEKDEHASVKGERREKIDKDLSQQVGGKRQDKVGGNYALDGGQEIHIKAGTNLILEAGAQLTLKAGSDFIHIGPEGVAIKGKMVLINSGGAAGSGGGSSPQDPKLPDVADDGSKGGKLS